MPTILHAQFNTTTLNWAYASTGLPFTEPTPRSIITTSLAQHPNRFAPTILLYVGTYGAGVYRSADSGKTWANVNNTTLGNRNVNMLFANGLNLYAGTDAGLYVTEDNANTWRIAGNTANGLFGNIVSCMTAGMLDNIPMLFVGTNVGVFRSTDNGLSWQYFNRGLLPTQYITALQIVGRRLFAGTPNGMFSYHLDSLRARDSIANNRWFPATAAFNPSPVNSFLPFQDGSVYAATGSGVWLSQDAGVTWTSVNRGLENADRVRPIVSGLAVNRTGIVTETTRILATTINGVFASPPASAVGGVLWNSTNTGFPIRAAGAIMVFNNEVFVTSGPNILRGTVFFSPPPIIREVSPSSVVARQGATRDTIITLVGDNFSNPLVYFEGVPLNRVSTSFSNVRVTLPKEQFALEGVKRFRLVNSDGQEATALFTVSGPVSPFIQNIKPDSLTVGGPSFEMTISGQTFLDSANVTVAGVSATVLQRIGRQFLRVQVPEAALAVAGRKFVRVTNTNGQFYDYPFKVRAFPPRITDISPPTVSVGNGDFQLTIRGFEFFTTANVEPFPFPPLTVRLGGVNLALAQPNTSREVIVNVPRSLVSSEATLRLILTNDDGQADSTKTLGVVPFGLSAIMTPQTTICPGARTILTSMLTSGVPPFRVVWTNDKGGTVDSSSIDANGVIRAVITPTQPTRYTLTVTDRGGNGVSLTQSIQIGILQPQATSPQAIRFDDVNTFFRLSTTQTIRFTNTSPDGTPLTITGISSGSGSFRAVSGLGQTVQAGQFLDISVLFEPTRDGALTDTMRINFGPCERFTTTVVSGFRFTPVLPPPPLIAVATAPDGRVNLGTAPPLSWLPVGFLSVPTGYTIQIARVDNAFSATTGFATPLFTGSVMQATTLQPAFQLQPNTAYAWTVRATNSVTTSTFAIPYYFITPPSTPQRVSLVPTRFEFGNVIVNETERRGAQITTTSAQAIDVIGADVFAPQGAPRAGFSLVEGVAQNFRRISTSLRIPANLIATFRPTDTVFYQGVLRFRTAQNDTLYAIMNGNGVQCVPSQQPSGEPCAETEIALQFKPFKDNKQRPEQGDTVTVQLVVRRSSGLDAMRYIGRARQFTADIAIGNSDVLFPRNITLPTNLAAAQRSLTRTRVRLQNVPIPATGIVQGNNIVLAEFSGETLVADTLVTSLRIVEFAWTDATGGNNIGDANIRKVLRDTLLTVETCVVNGSARLLRLKPARVLASLVIAPNPVRNSAETYIRTEAATPLEISLVSAMGQVVRKEIFTAQDAGDFHISMQTNDLPQGAYLLLVRAKNEILQRQIVVVE